MDIDWRALAAAVILRAIEDAQLPVAAVTNPSKRIEREMWRDTARQFLSGGALLRVWCDAAGLDAVAVTALLDQPRAGRKRRRYTSRLRRQTAA